jgi:hypothetical protein
MCAFYRERRSGISVNKCHAGTLGSPGVSSETSNGVNVGSDLEVTLALGTSNSNNELERFPPRRAIVHDDITPCVAVKI